MLKRKILSVLVFAVSMFAFSGCITVRPGTSTTVYSQPQTDTGYASSYYNDAYGGSYANAYNQAYNDGARQAQLDRYYAKLNRRQAAYAARGYAYGRNANRGYYADARGSRYRANPSSYRGNGRDRRGGNGVGGDHRNYKPGRNRNGGNVVSTQPANPNANKGKGRSVKFVQGKTGFNPASVIGDKRPGKTIYGPTTGVKPGKALVKPVSRPVVRNNVRTIAPKVKNQRPIKVASAARGGQNNGRGR